MSSWVIQEVEASLEKTKQSITGLTLVDCIERMAELHPETQDACIALLTARLEGAADNHESVNANIISTLVDWKAMDSLPVIERAFATGNVDLMVMGDFDDVQVELGLKEPDPNKPRYVHPAMQQALGRDGTNELCWEMYKDDRQQCAERGAVNMKTSGRAFALDQRQDDVAELIAAPSNALRCAFHFADDGFVDLDRFAGAAHGGELTGSHSLTDAMSHEPCGLVGHAEHTA